MKKEDLKHSRQYRQAFQNSKALLSVPMAWCVRFDLTATELLILRHIQYMSKQESGVFSGSIKGLCAITNCTLPTARKSCDALHNRGFIRKVERPHKLSNGRAVDWVCYRAIIPYDMSPSDVGIESLLSSELERRKAINYVKPIKGKIQ